MLLEQFGHCNRDVLGTSESLATISRLQAMQLKKVFPSGTTLDAPQFGQSTEPVVRPRRHRWKPGGAEAPKGRHPRHVRHYLGRFHRDRSRHHQKFRGRVVRTSPRTGRS